VTAKKFYDWQTAGGTDDVMRLVDCLERADISWCAIGGVAVNHWAEEPMVTRDVDFVVAAGSVGQAVALLKEAGFSASDHLWSVNFTGSSKVVIQLSTAEVYLAFPARSVVADVHGILLRVASLKDTLDGKILAWGDGSRRQSKRMKDFTDIVRLVEAHPGLRENLPENLKALVEQPHEM
jgi:hypothetical protein